MKNLKRVENVGTGCTSQQSTQTTSVAVHCAPERSVDCSECDTVQHFFALSFVSLLNQISDTMIYKPFHCAHHMHTKTCASLLAQVPFRANVNGFSFGYSLDPETYMQSIQFIFYLIRFTFDYVFVSKMPNLYEKL